MKRIIILLITGFLAANTYGQTSSAPLSLAEKGTIKGCIKENLNKTGLEYANIMLFSKLDSSLITGTITDKAGTFYLKDIPFGSYRLVAEFIGFKKFSLPELTVSRDNKNLELGDIFLEATAVELSEATVTAEKNLVNYMIDKKVVNIDKKLSAAGGNLVDALENTPSVQVDVDGNVSLRGSTNFTVLIDGKPTALSGNDALKQIPASAVANIEIITNPSAKFDPDGSAGIINIIMKKEFKKGTNGIINLAAGNYFQHNGNFNLNFRREKANFFIGGNYADRRRYPSTEIFNEQVYSDRQIFVKQNSDREQLNKSYSLKSGIDFYPSANSTLTLSGEIGFFGFNMKMPSRSLKSTSPSIEDIYYLNTGILSIGGNFVNSNFSYEQKFDQKGHKMVLGLNYSRWDGKNTSDVEIDTTNNTWTNILSASRYRTVQINDENEYRAKIDYTYPVNDKISLETGYQGRYKTVLSDFNKDNYLFGSKTWSNEAIYDNGLDYYLNIQALYFTISGKILGWDAKAGLRGEYSSRLLTVTATNDKYGMDLYDLFPTMHLSRKFGEKRQLQASYSRRINRPGEWNLNPFPVYSDNDIAQGGNPNLKPEYIDSYEMNFMRHFKKGFASAEAYYRQTNNAIEQTITKESSSGLIKIIPENLSKNFAYGVNLSSNLNLTKWFSVYASANIYSFNVKGDIVSALNGRKSLNSDFVLNSNFNLKKGTRIQLTGFYNAPKATSQGEQSEMYGVNLALRQEFMKNKLAVSLRVNDVFKTMQFKFQATTPGSGSGANEIPAITTNFKFKMDSPTVMLSLSYTLNNYKKRAEEETPQQNVGGGGIF
jgi:outer membrane receptor protein involved in Fe transport